MFALDKDLPVEIRLFSELVDQNVAQERLISTLGASGRSDCCAA